VFEKISHQLTENSNLINSLACRLWVTYFENSTLVGHMTHKVEQFPASIVGGWGLRKLLTILTDRALSSMNLEKAPHIDIR
ncbi:hypothetical protein, partial [Pseudomonas avellanae]|uniref:hypothetical protein n=1 Tax=Pseudomonas avellanae TaxID=46257 RepID=UPI001F4CC1F5